MTNRASVHLLPLDTKDRQISNLRCGKNVMTRYNLVALGFATVIKASRK